MIQFGGDVCHSFDSVLRNKIWQWPPISKTKKSPTNTSRRKCKVIGRCIYCSIYIMLYSTIRYLQLLRHTHKLFNVNPISYPSLTSLNHFLIDTSSCRKPVLTRQCPEFLRPNKFPNPFAVGNCLWIVRKRSLKNHFH